MKQLRGRFAPSPSGRMHLGNLFAALIAWLSVRSSGGELVLRIEDLDTQRCREEYARQLEQDLKAFGLDWDEGGCDAPAFVQSNRREHYEQALENLRRQGLAYPCYCTRAQRLLASAPHGAEPVAACPCKGVPLRNEPSAWRCAVPEREISFADLNYGPQRENLAQDCGDFIIRRRDGLFAYQLAVAVDDGAMGVTQVVRGRDLLSSTARQMYLMELLGYQPPEYGHVPLLVAEDGRRLSKREQDMDLGELLKNHTPQEIIGDLAFRCGLLVGKTSATPQELIGEFSWEKLSKKDILI